MRWRRQAAGKCFCNNKKNICSKRHRYRIIIVVRCTHKHTASTMVFQNAKKNLYFIRLTRLRPHKFDAKLIALTGFYFAQKFRSYVFCYESSSTFFYVEFPPPIPFSFATIILWMFLYYNNNNIDYVIKCAFERQNSICLNWKEAIKKIIWLTQYTHHTYKRTYTPISI